MKTIGDVEAARRFNELLDEARTEPVAITRPGEPTLVVTTGADYEQLLALKEQRFKDAIQAGFAQLDSGEHSSLSAEDIAQSVLADQRGK